MSALRWLSHGDWATATRDGLAVVDGQLVLATVPGSAAHVRHGVAVLPAGAPDPAQRASSGDDRWRRVVVRLGAPVPAGCWLRVWTQVTAAGVGTVAAPDPRVDDDDRALLPTAPGTWRAAAVDAVDVRVLCPAAGAVWVAIELGGDAAGSPRVSDVRVESADDGPVTQLPVAYRSDPTDPASTVDDGDGVLGRYLGLLGAEAAALASLVDELPAQLSPAVAPDRPDSPWVVRLAAWLALDPVRLPTSDADRRETVATAVTRHGWRGTRRGLVDQVRRETGLAVEVVEPLASAAVWRLDAAPATSALGLTTGLVPADPGPPVLDRSARLDGAGLVTAEEAGSPVHARLAHRICVHVPGGTEDDVDAVDAVVQRERPAHVLARTCAVARRTTVPTTVGVDALPPPGPPGLADDQAYLPTVAGPGVRLGTARVAAHDRPAPHSAPSPAPTGEAS